MMTTVQKGIVGEHLRKSGDLKTVEEIQADQRKTTTLTGFYPLLPL